MMKVDFDDDVIDKLMAKFDAMADGLTQLERTMPEELTNWQREDLKRVKTFTDTPAPLVAFTKVWRRWKKHGWRVPRQRGRPRRGQSKSPKSSAPTITHAILSPKLSNSLHRRMVDLVVRSMTGP
jgi:hypothetical protein